jgi:hypothetical protein
MAQASPEVRMDGEILRFLVLMTYGIACFAVGVWFGRWLRSSDRDNGASADNEAGQWRSRWTFTQPTAPNPPAVRDPATVERLNTLTGPRARPEARAGVGAPQPAEPPPDEAQPAAAVRTRGAVSTQQFGALAEFADLETVAREFVGLCDERQVDFEAARAWFGHRGCNVRSLTGIADWGVLEVEKDSFAVVVPAVRRAMADVPLHEYFDLVNYNGVQPIIGDMITKFGRRRRIGREWKAVRKGEIHG